MKKIFSVVKGYFMTIKLGNLKERKNFRGNINNHGNLSQKLKT